MLSNQHFCKKLKKINSKTYAVEFVQHIMNTKASAFESAIFMLSSKMLWIQWHIFLSANFDIKYDFAL